jgi:hypothetical protein
VNALNLVDEPLLLLARDELSVVNEAFRHLRCGGEQIQLAHERCAASGARGGSSVCAEAFRDNLIVEPSTLSAALRSG